MRAHAGVLCMQISAVLTDRGRRSRRRCAHACTSRWSTRARATCRSGPSCCPRRSLPPPSAGVFGVLCSSWCVRVGALTTSPALCKCSRCVRSDAEGAVGRSSLPKRARLQRVEDRGRASRSAPSPVLAPCAQVCSTVSLTAVCGVPGRNDIALAFRKRQAQRRFLAALLRLHAARCVTLFCRTSAGACGLCP